MKAPAGRERLVTAAAVAGRLLSLAPGSTPVSRRTARSWTRGMRGGHPCRPGSPGPA
jgi:hypothetical protein